MNFDIAPWYQDGKLGVADIETDGPTLHCPASSRHKSKEMNRWHHLASIFLTCTEEFEAAGPSLHGPAFSCHKLKKTCRYHLVLIFLTCTGVADLEVVSPTLQCPA